MGSSCASPRSWLRAANGVIRTGRGTDSFYGRVFGSAVLRRPGRTLDVGAGDSPYGARRPAVVRVDPAYRHDPPVVAVGCVSAVGEALPFRDGAFDTVLASFVLQHVTDPDRCLRELFRVCSASGIIAVFPLWRPSRLTRISDPVLAGHAVRRPAPGMMDALVIRRPPDTLLSRLAAGLAASGALGPPLPVAACARWGMSALIRARRTTRFRVLHRRPASPQLIARGHPARTTR